MASIHVASLVKKTHGDFRLIDLSNASGPGWILTAAGKGFVQRDLVNHGRGNIIGYSLSPLSAIPSRIGPSAWDSARNGQVVGGTSPKPSGSRAC